MKQQKLKQTEIGLIPEDWNVENILENSTLKARIGWQGLTTSEYLKTGEFVLVGGTDFKNGKIDWENCFYVDEKRYSQDRNIQLREGDVLVTKDGTIGKIAYVDKLKLPTTLNSGVFVIRPKYKNYITKYFFYILTSDFFDKFLNKLKAGSTISHLYQKDFSSFDFILPKSLEEQTSIAEALSDTDLIIESLDKLIVKKKNIKQGAMQELLTGKRRLLEFKGEWEVKKLGEVVEINKGQLITNDTRVDGTIPVIAGGKTFAYYHNKANRFGKTITISCSGASAGYIAFHDYPIFASDCSTIEDSKKYSIEYIYFLLQLLQESIYKMQTGGAQPHIHPSDLEPIPISISRLVEEQSAIAEILSDMDTEIQELERKKDKYQKIKIGMVQELLTGRIRLI